MCETGRADDGPLGAAPARTGVARGRAARAHAFHREDAARARLALAPGAGDAHQIPVLADAAADAGRDEVGAQSARAELAAADQLELQAERIEAAEVGALAGEQRRGLEVVVRGQSHVELAIRGGGVAP